MDTLVVTATGVVSAWLVVGSWSALTGTGYGRILLIKLALVVPAAVGLYRSRGTQLTLALVVLGVTAVLALTPTPTQLLNP